MRCPNCGETAVREFGNEGGTIRECDACSWWEWEPPEPSVEELLERHKERYREQWDDLMGSEIFDLQRSRL